MRIDLTLSDGGPERDVALLVPEGATLTDVAAVVPGSAAGEAPAGYPALCVGARVGSRPPEQPPGHRLTVVGGPGAGRHVPLGPTPVVVGRAPGCGLSLPDPRLSRQHLAASLGPHGPMLRDLGSVNGTAVDGRRLGGTWRDVAAGELVRAADSFLAVSAGPGRAVPVRPAADGTGVVAPGRARTADGRPAGAIDMPTPPTLPDRSRISWVAMLAPAAAGVALAAALRAWTFLLLAVLSPVAMLAGGLVERWRDTRSRRRLRGDFARAEAAAAARVRAGLRAEAQRRRVEDPDPGQVALVAAGPGPRLWERRVTAPGVLRVRIGLAAAESELRTVTGGVARPAGTVPAVPHCVDLAAGALAIAGPIGPCRAVGRWLVAQLATFVAPTDLEVALLLDEPAAETWRWVRWLPHWRRRTAIGADAQRALLAELAAERHARELPARAPGRWTLLVVDGCTEPGALAGLLDGAAAAGLTAICVDRGDAPPCAVRAVAADDVGSRLRLAGGATVVADQVDERWADALARALAPLRPATDGAAALPEIVRLPDLVPGGTPWPAEVAGLPVVLGAGPAGPVVVDLVRDGPHALVAGTTGAGKSELLRAMVASLALAQPPDRLVFVLIDYKGGSAFAECARLPHTAGCVTDLDAHLTARALRSLEREVRRREALLAAAGAADLAAYLAGGAEPALARLVIVVDEFAALADELPDFVTGLVGIAQRGRSLGIHLVLATQRPSGVVSPEIRANTSLRIALRVTDAADSRDVIDCEDAALLERRTPGRAVLRVAGADAVPFQAASVSMPPARPTAGVRVVELDGWRGPAGADGARDGGSDLGEITDRLAAAAAACGLRRPQPPWLPPLPDLVAVSQLRATGGGVPVGLLDLPDEQAQRPLAVDVGTGCGVVIAGAARSGRTSALLVLALQAAQRYAPEELQICAVDLGGGLGPLGVLPHTGSVVTDAATAAALLRRLAATGRDGPRQLLLVDGFEQLAAASERADHGDTVAALLELLRAAASTGTTVAVAGGRAVLQPRVAGAAGLRLALRLADPADFALGGVPAKAVPRRMPAGRAVTCPDGAEVQLAAPPPDVEAVVAGIAARRAGRPPGRIVVRALPRRVALDDLPAAPGRLVLGVGGDAAQPLAVDPFSGLARLLVCGPPGSGRTTTLLSLRDQATRHGWAVALAAPPRSALAAEPPDLAAVPVTRPLLILVDDAEDLVDTPVEAALLAAAAEREASGGAVALVAGTTSEQAAIGYRGLIADARRSRCLLLLHPGPAEAALVTARLPRPDGPQPPGRGVVVGSRAWGAPFAAGPVPVQVAMPGELSPRAACADSGDRWAG